jgi:pimeloyl-ACP methyl ester carboxylesterase
MFIRVRRDLHSRSGRALLYPVVAFLALASIGGAYATVGAAADARAYPMSGQLIDVGGHRLHLNCTGSGSPTVVLQPGGGDMASSLGWIAPAVAQHTRVCVYDRAGRAWSEPADHPQDGYQVAADLHALLQTAGVPGPYVLAGHSFGGQYVLAYAARYPNDVAGMVLIDATNVPSSPKPGAKPPAAGAPTASSGGSPPWSRFPRGSAWPACTLAPPTATYRRSRATRYGHRSPSQAIWPAPSRSSAWRAPSPSRPQLCRASATSLWSC